MSDAPNSSSQTAPANGPLSDKLERVLAKAGLDPQQRPSGQAPVAESAPPQELEVDQGGVKRRVPVAELVKTWTERETIAASKKALDERLAEMGDQQSVRALQERIEGLDPARRAQVLQLLQGASAPQTDEVDDAIDDAFAGNARQPQTQNGADRKLSEIEQAVRILAAERMERHRAEVAQSRASQVDELMGQFPVFETNKGAAKFAKQAIMNALAGAPQVGRVELEQQVSQAASQLQEFVASQQRALREEVGVPARFAPRDKERGHLTGKGLMSGEIRRMVMDHLANQSG